MSEERVSEESIRVPQQQSMAFAVGRAFGAGNGDFVSEWQRATAPFDELVASWNVRGEPFVVLAQVGVNGDAAGNASPWVELGSFGELPRDRTRVLEFAGGKVDTDVILARDGARFHSTRLRFRSTSECRLERFDLSFTDRQVPRVVDESDGAGVAPIALDVPFFSQKDAPDAIRSRICSPTSVAMVLRYYGRTVTPESVAAEVFDREQDLYGIWPRNVQIAFRHGVPGAVRRFANWREVAAEFAKGRPIIASIGVAKGQLDNAPYETTSGHLIVLRGFDRNGDVLVNDPAGATAESGRVTYRREQLTRCWLARGGTAYLLGDGLESSHVRH